MKTNLQPVESSLIAAIGYDAESQVLEIQFKGRVDAPGPIYQYQNVTPPQYESLIHAESIGGCFLRNIKNKPEYPCEKVETPQEDAK